MTAPRVRVLDLATKIPRPAEGVRIAAIDIGSNSIRQIVADVSTAGSIRIIDEMKAALSAGDFTYTSYSCSNGESSKESTYFEEALSSPPQTQDIKTNELQQELEEDLEQEINNLQIDDIDDNVSTLL